MLKEILLATLIQQVPPGETKFSLEPATDCAAEAATCPGAIRSDGGWARRETAEHAKERYARISEALVDAAAELLCVDASGKRLDGCKPADDVQLRGKRRWTLTELAMTTAAAMVYESGLREDVMNGRGRAKKPSADGGEGRGPGNEACLLQIHPTIGWRFAEVDGGLRARAERGEPGAREEVLQGLLGGEPAQLRACFQTGMRMLIRARAHCEWYDQYGLLGRGKPGKPSQYHWTFLTFSMYGTGQSCYSPNGSKTSFRSSMAEQLIARAVQKLAAERAAERATQAKR